MPATREQTFLTLVHDNDARLRRICRVYASDPESAKDLRQEILLQLWRSIDSFAGRSSPATWLYRVALNTAIRHVRRQPHNPVLSLDADGAEAVMPLAADHAAGGDDALEEAIDARARRERLHAAIERLNSVDKMLMTMYLDERSYHDMADVLGISEVNVGVKLHRIRKALAEWLAEETV